MSSLSSPCCPCHPYIIPFTPTSSLNPHLTTHPPHSHPGGTPQISKNSITLEWDILIPFKDLKSVETPPPMGGWIVWWVGGWMGGLMGGTMSNHKKMGGLTGRSMDGVFPVIPMLSMPSPCHPCHPHIVPVIPTSSPDPHLKHTHPHPTLGIPQISKNSITLERIEIFSFCLKIWNPWRLPHPWVGVWCGWVG